MTFRKELESLINQHSMENASNTPDFILAQFLEGCLATFDTAVQQRETWYGRDPRPIEKFPPMSQPAPQVTSSAIVHASDCAVHNGPAYPPGPCDCGAVR